MRLFFYFLTWLTFKKCKFIYGLYCIVWKRNEQTGCIHVKRWSNQMVTFIIMIMHVKMCQCQFNLIFCKHKCVSVIHDTQWLQTFPAALTQIFPLQGFSLPLLGVHQSIFGDHLNKQLLKERNPLRSLHFKIIQKTNKKQTNWAKPVFSSTITCVPKVIRLVCL